MALKKTWKRDREGRMWWPTCISLKFQKDRGEKLGRGTIFWDTGYWEFLVTDEKQDFMLMKNNDH